MNNIDIRMSLLKIQSKLTDTARMNENMKGRGEGGLKSRECGGMKMGKR